MNEKHVLSDGALRNAGIRLESRLGRKYFAVTAEANGEMPFVAARLLNELLGSSPYKLKVHLSGKIDHQGRPTDVLTMPSQQGEHFNALLQRMYDNQLFQTAKQGRLISHFKIEV